MCNKFVLLIVLIGLVAADHIDKNAETKSFSNDVGPDGSYQYSYETSNGISAQESGNGGYSVSGSAQWVALDGTPVQLVYTADEEGYKPQGAHLPTPPPTPDYVLRAIDWIRAHPPKDEPYNQQQKRF